MSLDQLTGAVVISLITAWVTVQLALRRFRAERLWDRKVQAYERILDAFHNAKKYTRENLYAVYDEKEIPKERQHELIELSKLANEDLYRAIDIGSFTLSAECIELLTLYQKEKIADTEYMSFHEHLDHDYDVNEKYLKLLIAEAKRDLKSNP